LKVMGALVESPPLALPALTSQALRFDGEVPHDPVPTVPVTTLNVVVGSAPLELMVTGVAVAMSHPPGPVEVVRHSTR
jgi:hypothetical protein